MSENREHYCLLEQMGNGTRHISQHQYYITFHRNSNNLSFSHSLILPRLEKKTHAQQIIHSPDTSSMQIDHTPVEEWQH